MDNIPFELKNKRQDPEWMGWYWWAFIMFSALFLAAGFLYGDY